MLAATFTSAPSRARSAAPARAPISLSPTAIRPWAISMHAAAASPPAKTSPVSVAFGALMVAQGPEDGATTGRSPFSAMPSIVTGRTMWSVSS